MGLGLLHTIVSSEDDWDRYESYQWYAAEGYSRRNPGDPDKDVLTRLINGEHDGRKLTETELLQNCIFILNAGYFSIFHICDPGNLFQNIW